MYHFGENEAFEPFITASRAHGSQTLRHHLWVRWI